MLISKIPVSMIRRAFNGAIVPSILSGNPRFYTAPRFNVGDVVTFDSYGKRIPAKVKEINLCDLWGNNDGRIWYRLTGAARIPLTSICTAASILEARRA